MSHFDLRRFKAIPDLPLRILFYASAVFEYFISYFNLIVYPPAILPWKHCHGDPSVSHVRYIGLSYLYLMQISIYVSKADFFSEIGLIW